MQWDSSPNAGFSPATARKTWLPLAPDWEQNNVIRQLEQPDSLLNLYRQLLALRKSSLSLQTGDYLPLDTVPGDCFAYRRRLAGYPAMLVALNFSSDDIRLNLPDLKAGRLILSTYMDRSEQINLGELTLRGVEGVLIELPGE